MFSFMTLNSLFLSGSLTDDLQQLQVVSQANDAIVSETTNISKWKTAKTAETPCIRAWKNKQKTNIGNLSQ